MQVQRLFVGGLQLDTTEELLRQRFAAFGQVQGIELSCQREPCFAHLDLIPRDAKAVDRCITTVRA